MINTVMHQLRSRPGYDDASRHRSTPVPTHTQQSSAPTLGSPGCKQAQSFPASPTPSLRCAGLFATPNKIALTSLQSEPGHSEDSQHTSSLTPPCSNPSQVNRGQM